MAELKRTFTGGKMNKDLDERFVPKNQYRHAINVQVRESDSDAAGTVQNLQGNALIGETNFATWMTGNGTYYNYTMFGDNPGFYEVVEGLDENLPICVASVADEKNDKGYFFFTHDINFTKDVIKPRTLRKWVDTIVQQDVNGLTTRVVNDHWATSGGVMEHLPMCGQEGVIDEDCYQMNSNGAGSVSTTGIIENPALESIQNDGWTKLLVKDGRNYRVGMTMHAYGNLLAGTMSSTESLGIGVGYNSVTDADGNLIDLFATNGPNPKIKAIEGNVLIFDQPISCAEFELALSANVVTVDFGFTLLSDIQIVSLVFKHPKALNFDIQKRKQITGINVIDNLLFWTDNCSEPKKINIDRCIAGTVSDYHTKLFLDNNSSPSSLVDSANLKPNLEVHNGYWNNVKNRWDINSDLKESHLTVLRKAPTYAPTIEMSDSERTSMGGTVDVLVDNYSFVTTEGEISEFTLNVGDIRTIVGDNLSQTRFRKDDILEITEQGVNPLLESFIVIKAKFIAYEDELGAEVFTGPTDRIRIKVISIQGDTVSPEDLNWRIKLLERDPLFETKFVRFGCRYKYEDGEYSTFGPWSRLAFLPGQFDYSSKNGYNLGMVNNVRELIIRDFIAYDIPQDVTEVDILYKATDNANVYTAQTITRNKSPEWDMFTPQINGVEINTGELYITSEMIHRVLPEMQLFRSWDNVPRYALAQEVVANRLVYGNYYQGYNMDDPIRLTQTISSDAATTLSEGYPSLKSLRNYRVGVVFGDKYGRETPVFTNGYVTNAGTAGDVAVSGDIYIDKNLSSTKNRFLLSQDWTDPSLPGISKNPPDWLVDGGYIKYFIKETSNEYYNLVLDRWYDSGDDTIWLSFNSADRNKVDEETHLILKNQHTTHQPVYDKAKYKILAIENEAPDYIRTRYVNLGEVKDLEPGNTDSMWESGITDSNQSPTMLYNVEPDDPGTDGFSFKITQGAWNTGSVGFTSDEDLGIFGMQIEDPIELQFIGKRIDTGTGPNATLKSEWRKISNYNKDGDANTGFVRFVWTKAFKDDDTGGVDFPSIFAQLYPDLDNVFDSGVSLEWSVKFRMAIKENRPEFDGKFFVKINKDTALINHVMDLGVGIGGTWVPEEEFQLSYIDSQFENPTDNDMATDPLGGDISKFSSWGPGEDTTYVTWFGAFDMLAGSGANNSGNSEWSPQVDGAPDPYWFDAPYWSDGLGNSGYSSNTIPYLYNGPEADDDFGMLALLDQEYYGWSSGSTYNANGVSPYMPFVPLEYMPGMDGEDYISNDDLENLQFDNPQDSIWGVTGFVDWCQTCSAEQLTGLQFVPGAGGPGNNGTQGVAPANPYGAGIFGGTCGPMFEWYTFNEATKNFWQDYAVNYAPGGGITSSAKTGGNVFLDGAGARRYLTTIKNEATEHNISYAETVYDQNGDLIPNHYYYEYYKPLPLEKGIVENEGSDTGSGTTSDQFGRMNLGVTLYNYKQNISINKASRFFDKMTTVGTVFKFTSDPNQQVYKVIWAENKAWYDDGTMGGPNARMTSNVHSNYYNQPTGDGFVVEGQNNQGFTQLNGTWTNMNSEIGTSGCQPVQSNNIGNDFNVGRRLNCAIEFRKVNLETGGTGAEGMDIDDFDPRSKARHDGSSSMGVQVMRLGFNYDSLEGDDDLASTELGACFETEPKEDVGLDLYYEASNALPIVLTRENMLNYTPINSSIYVLRKSAGIGDIIKRIKFPEYAPRVRNIYSKRDSDGSSINSRGVIVSIAQTSTVEPLLFKKEIWPTDTLVFEHPDGTETQSNVINYVEPIDYPGDGIVFNNITSNEFNSGVVEHPRAFKVVDPIPLTFYADVGNTDPDQDLYNLTMFTITAGAWDSDYSNVDVEQLIGGLITGVIQSNNELIVPHGLFVQDFIFNHFDWDGNTYHTLIIGGDATSFVCTPLNPNPPNGIQGENNVELSISPRTGYYEIDPDVWKYPVKLGWFNCYGFGNGVESDRIRDDFNAPTITNGVKVSTTVVGYGEENISSGMIYSGLYNSTSQMNNLNEFNMADKVTKDLNPAYGSIQAMKTRDTDVVVFAEDKVLKVIANKDAVYNADGNPQLVATNRTLGQSVPFVGDYGISKNPESLAYDQYRMYFTDKQRGAVLRLSRDGLTPISDVGMKTWFRHQLRHATNALGTFDDVSGEYNLTLDPIYENSTLISTGDAATEIYTNTVSFNEKSKGWVSFKSFVPTNGVSVSGNYLTTSGNKIWRHYAPSYREDGSCSGAFSNLGCSYRNNWYGIDSVDSQITMVFNDQPGIVKSFKTLDYEGSQAKINKSIDQSVEWKSGVTDTFYDNDYNNLVDKNGWWADNMKTDLEKGKVHEFRKKEGKWFHQIGGLSWDYNDSDMVNNRDLITESLDVQGIGVTSGSFVYDETLGVDVIQVAGCIDEDALNFNNSANYNVPSSCVFEGCSDNRIIGVDILQNNPAYSEGTSMYGKFFASNYIGNVYDNVSCEDDAGQTFNPLNLEGGWVDQEGAVMGPWVPSCCTYYGCTDASAINYVGDDLAPYVENCTNDANATIDDFATDDYVGTNCEPCAYDCGGGNIEGVGFNATCGCNDNTFLEYWDYAQTNLSNVYTITQPTLLVTYNNEPYHYNDDTQCVTPIIYGCTDPNAYNWYNTQNSNMTFTDNANVDDGSCISVIPGCMDPEAANYNPDANLDDGTCQYYDPIGELTVQNDENN